MINLLLQAPTNVPPETISQFSGARLFFWFFASLVIAGSVMTITRRNMVAAVMWLVLTFFGIAALFALLDAHFIAVLQILVYAGAIMVLFVFVVMVLNRDEIDPVAWNEWFVKIVIGAPALISFTYLVGTYLKEWAQTRHATFGAAPAGFGSVEKVGTVLFTDYLFAFEAISILLLIAVIAAVVVARAVKHFNPGDAASREQHEHAADVQAHGGHAAAAHHAPQGHH